MRMQARDNSDSDAPRIVSRRTGSENFAPTSMVLPIGAVQLRSISYLVQAQISILIHGVQNPDQQEWNDVLAATAPLVRAGELRGVLIRSAGGGPNPHQRRQVIELYEGQNMPVANVSDSTFTRAITTAIGWFYKGSMRSFSPEDLHLAVEFLGVSESQRLPMVASVRALCEARGIT